MVIPSLDRVPLAVWHDGITRAVYRLFGRVDCLRLCVEMANAAESVGDGGVL
jgi:hypothetical protein